MFWLLNKIGLAFTALAQTMPCGPIAGGGYRLCAQIPGGPATITGPAEYLTVLYKYGVAVVGLVGFAALVYAGVNYILNRGNAAALTDVKDQIYQAIFGIILLLFAALLLNEINPDIAKLKDVALPNLKVPELDQSQVNAAYQKYLKDFANTQDLLKSNLEKDYAAVKAGQFSLAAGPGLAGVFLTYSKEGEADNKALNRYFELLNRDGLTNSVYKSLSADDQKAFLGKLITTSPNEAADYFAKPSSPKIEDVYRQMSPQIAQNFLGILTGATLIDLYISMSPSEQNEFIDKTTNLMALNKWQAALTAQSPTKNASLISAIQQRRNLLEQEYAKGLGSYQPSWYEKVVEKATFGIFK